VNPPFATPVNLENIKLGSRVQRGNWADGPHADDWGGWPDHWDMDGGYDSCALSTCMTQTTTSPSHIHTPPPPPPTLSLSIFPPPPPPPPSLSLLHRPHVDGWGGTGTVIGWRNIIGEVTGKDPGHALYAAVRWDNQVLFVKRSSARLYRC
jgi:hypothetical protein